MNARALLFLSAIALTGCGNPVADAEIAALGDEVPGVAQGEFHRPGQPCTLCHSDYYGAGDVFSIAGTIFAFPATGPTDEPVPAPNATVTLYDTTGIAMTATTNCVGNFFLTQDQYNPQFPLDVFVDADLPTTPSRHAHLSMDSRVSRQGSCAGCHFLQLSQVSPGWVFVTTDKTVPFTKPDAATCPGAANFP
ncbi:MAG TPA: hypothetical protein VGM56_27395 [Byssovorax sp.]|jgi:hypothetical protein